ncbi:hypothetical protein HPB49_023229 [Dermacentor silvarum]|uniref:Uncharacterized protein n=1 Tax=Dermacentor silvarum TaxID=543639 RepID=A0ACB8E3T5_DERSI|nr:hypothetical protein HPB49_023229 [Dermacentor silvarum]
MIRLVVECGSVAPPVYSFGVLAGYPHIHPRDRLTCMLTMQNCISPESNSGRNGVITQSSCCCRQDQREDTVSAINRVVVLYGETGSGKITEAGQFIFEYYIRGGQGSRCNMLVTQSRRIAAISMAKQAPLEWHEELSDTVVFHVRHTKQLLTSRGGKLFCTAGILLRPLQQNVELQGVSHVIVDEVHERDVCTDFLLVLLREVLSIHRTFKAARRSCSWNGVSSSVFSLPAYEYAVVRGSFVVHSVVGEFDAGAGFLKGNHGDEELKGLKVEAEMSPLLAVLETPAVPLC